MNDNDIIAMVSRATQGDKAAINDLLGAIRNEVYNLSLRMIGDPDEAGDATQEILLRIYKGIGAFRGDSSFKTWYYRVATNYLLTDLSKKKTAVVSLDALGPRLETGLSEPLDSMERAEKDMLAAEVKVACTLGMMQCLSEEGRVVYILGEIIGINSVQGASILGMSGDNFRQKLSKARKKITGFAGQYCGLVNPSAKCSCERAINRSLASGFVDKNRLRFAQQGLALAEKLDRIVGESTQLFAMIPQYDSPAKVNAAIKQLLVTEKLF